MLVFNSPYPLFIISMLYMSVAVSASEYPLSVAMHKRTVPFTVAQHALFEDGYFRDRISAYKDTAVKRWQELPVWGKYLAGGAAAAGLFGSLCFVNYLRQDAETDSEDMLIVRNVSADDVRDALSKGAHDAQALLDLLSADSDRVDILKGVFRRIMSEPYTEKEEVIITNLVSGFQSLLQSTDWYELHQYACDHAAPDNKDRFKNWFTTSFEIQHD